MSKAIQGAALLAGAVGLGAAAFFDPALLASPLFDKALTALVLGGISMEAGAIAGALTSNRGQNITTRQAAAFRQIIYGEQRVGGVQIYQSTTGSHHDQYNFVIVLAGHTIDSIVNLYLDGRQVFWQGGVGNTTRNGVNFGGSANGNTYTGPNGQQYNFGRLVYCEARFGDQANGDVIGGLTANDPHWAASSAGSPYVGGCAYVYLKIEYDENMFPSLPEIRFTVRGKNNIYDPRTSTIGFSTNWGLIVADVLTDTQFGLGLDYATWINRDQAIAAANVCDEQVAVAATGVGSEARYATHYHYDTSVDPGSVLETMMAGAQGRLSFIGGEYYIWPAYWQGPSFAFDQSAVTSNSIHWTPQRSLRDRCNRVNGTYTAPNYPYNAAGNLYDANGFYLGGIQNNFPFAFQPTNAPQYAADVLHGYPSDQYLAEDLGTPLPHEMGLQTVLSVTQWQRCAKIHLMRNRQQGSGSWDMGLQAFPMQEMDVLNFTHPGMGWSGKVLEVQNVAFNLTEGSEDEAPTVRLQYTFAETDANVYLWNPGEELTVYDVPALPTQAPYTPAPPTDLELTSGASTALIAADGTVTPRIEVQWTEPYDRLTRQIQIQHSSVLNSTLWIDDGLVDVANTLAFVGGVVAGQAYNVRIRGVRANGGFSVWVEVDGYTVSTTLSVGTQTGVGIGSLVGEAFADGTGAIVCNPFTARIGNLNVSVLPAGYTITAGIAQAQIYYVYYIDPTFAGGNVTPIATQNQSDYLGHVGYFLIDNVVTPVKTAGSPGTPTGPGTGMRFAPSTSHDVGSRTTSNPGAAYDGNSSSFATISSSSTTSAVGGGDPTTTESDGDIYFQGFPSTSSSAASALTVSAEVDGGAGGSPLIVAYIGSAGSSLLSSYTSGAQAMYSLSIPAGTQFNTVSIEVSVQPADSELIGSEHTRTTTCNVKIFEIYIQT